MAAQCCSQDNPERLCRQPVCKSSNSCVGGRADSAGVHGPKQQAALHCSPERCGHQAANCTAWAQDLVIPAYKSPGQVAPSPLLGFAPKERTMLAFFQGDLGVHREPSYSRGLRQQLRTLAAQQAWNASHGIHIVDRQLPGSLNYGQALSSSVFCLVLPGAQWCKTTKPCGSLTCCQNLFSPSCCLDLLGAFLKGRAQR